FYLCGLTLDGVNGVSVLTYARETIGEALATAKHASTMFRNGTSIGGVLQAKGKLGPEGVQALRDSLEAYRGAENAHK
ncbi:phage portal protein, partial [Klebsiella pneumoniae]